jgi:GT2 family glycosyltransferase
VALFCGRLDNSIRYWCGNHSQCEHGDLTRKQYQPLDENGGAVQFLQELFEKVKGQAEKFVKGTSSNVV